MAQNESAGAAETRKPSLQSAIKTSMAQDLDKPRPAAGSKGQALLMTAGAVALTLGAGVFGAVYQNYQLRGVEAASLERLRAAEELDRGVASRLLEVARREADVTAADQALRAGAERNARTEKDLEQRTAAVSDLDRTVRAQQSEMARRETGLSAREQLLAAGENRHTTTRAELDRRTSAIADLEQALSNRQAELERLQAAATGREAAISSAEQRVAERTRNLEERELVAQAVQEAAEKQVREINSAFIEARMATSKPFKVCNRSSHSIQIARAFMDIFHLNDHFTIEQWLVIKPGDCATENVRPGKVRLFALTNPMGPKVWRGPEGQHVQCLSRRAMIVQWRAVPEACLPEDIRAEFMQFDIGPDGYTHTFTDD